MAANTKNPALLRDVFSALGNDPDLVAECYVRPRLAERLIRKSYAMDPEIHRRLRETAEMELLAAASIGELVSGTPTIQRHRIVKNDGTRLASSLAARGQHEIHVSPSEWDAIVQRLAAQIGPSDPSAMVESADAVLSRAIAHGPSPLLEDTDSFRAVQIMDIQDGVLDMAVAIWPKRPFDDWLSETSRNLQPGIPEGSTYRMPKLSVSERCVNDMWTPTDEVSAPDGRSAHAVVWTGTEMIIWGGYSAGGLDSGARYDPAADTWAATSMTGVPVARYNHTALWTGTEMIVWGGYDGAPDYYNSGGRYNPATDTWNATALSGAPSARERHTAVWTGTEMIVWGGWGGPGPTSSGGRYDPATNSWAATTYSNAPLPRHLHVAVWTGTEMIVFGGYVGYVTNTGGRYNPTTDAWSVLSTSGAPSVRAYFDAVWTGSEMVVWGGTDFSTYTDSGGRFDPSSGTWAATNPTGAPSGRQSHRLAWTGEEMIVWGGHDGTTQIAAGGRYDPGADSWTTTTTTGEPTARDGYGAIWTGAGEQLIVWGGYDGTDRLHSGGAYCASDLLGIDFGDAADPTYPTYRASDGARHYMYGTLYLGASVDHDDEGQPDPGAHGDDGDGNDDEDGVTLPPRFDAGTTTAISVSASAPGYLSAWVDLNKDGDWLDAGEQVLEDVAVTAGVNTPQITIPLDASTGATASRFRLDSVGGLTPSGLADDGEVEDYVLSIDPTAELAVTISDSVDPITEGEQLTYTVTLVNNGQADASGVNLSTTLAPELTFVGSTPGSPDCTESSSVVSCDLGSLTAGASTQVEIVAEVNLGVEGTVTTSTQVTLNEADPVAANNSTNEGTVVNRIPEIFADGFESGDLQWWTTS
jgi:uncharacterized repeat protein (TIGR01451 family)